MKKSGFLGRNDSLYNIPVKMCDTYSFLELLILRYISTTINKRI